MGLLGSPLAFKRSCNCRSPNPCVSLPAATQDSHEWRPERAELPGSVDRDAGYVDKFLDRVADSWIDQPDQRFGQFIRNVVRCSHDRSGRRRGPDEVDRITDEAFLLVLDESDEQMRRWREEAERRRRGELEEPVVDHRGCGLWGHLSPEARKEAMEQSVRRTIAMYDRWALKTFGRVGRDPARIGPFLRSLGQIWLEHTDLRFGELVCSGLPLEPDPERPGRRSRVGLPFLEEDEFLRLLRKPSSSSGGLVQIVMELLRPRGVAELGERLRRNLPDSLPSEVELPTDLIEGSGMAVQ
jgi:hypothetical protein